MVPVIKDGERWIHDSFALAQHVSSPSPLAFSANGKIEEKYATGERTLFPGSEAFARFLSTWADKDLANEIIPFLAPWMYQAQNAESSAWFLKQKIGNNKAKMECMIEAVKDPKFVESQTAAIRGKLATMEQYLDENKRAGKGRFLAGTDYPSHADATVWGWYATTVAVRPKELELESRTWKHESLPLVSAWVEAVKEGSGIKLEYLH